MRKEAMQKKPLVFDQLEDRIALTGCAGFGAQVAAFAQTGNVGDYHAQVTGPGQQGDIAALVHYLQHDSCDD